MNRKLKTHFSFLDLLGIASAKQRRNLLTTMTFAQMQTLCEVIYNVLKGTIPVTKKYINSLLHHQNVIRTLASRSVSKSRCKNVTVETSEYHTSFD